MTNIGIDDKNRDQVGKVLNRVLADEFVLYTKTRGYHWNVVGPQFNGLHKFFEEQYDELADIIDEVVLNFTAKPGVKVRISIEIDAESEAGFEDGLQRAVRENCNVLRFKNAEFD